MKRFLLTGHVDHGKSTLGGHLLYKCAAIDEREKEKTFMEAEEDKMSSFKWARLLDLNKDERDRGMTVECNEVEFIFNNKNYMLIDTPGHKLFIPNLVNSVFRNREASAGLVGVLVMSALPNEIDSAIAHGQIKEDITILKAIGVESLVVAVNKLDKLEWNVEAYKNACNKINPFLKKARFTEILYGATSGFEGLGLIEKAPFEDAPLSLIDLITNAGNNSAETQFGPSVTTSELQITIFILNCPIFSAGYVGVVHTSTGEYSFEVKKLCQSTDKSKRKVPYLKNNQKGNIWISTSSKTKFRTGERVVFRRDSTTIAFGIIIATK